MTIRSATLAACVALAGTFGTERAAAQSGGDGFLFQEPRVSFSFRGGLSMPRAGGGNGGASLWDDTREFFTVETSDLTGPLLVGELAIRLNEMLDLTIGVSHHSSSFNSEYRDWVGDDDLPIAQHTTFTTTPITAGVRAYPLSRGRSIGNLAWIPRTLNPFVGIAGGFVNYRFDQSGEFIDYETYDIYRDGFLSQGRGATLHFSGGVEVSVNRHLMLVGEAKYAFGSGPLSSDFVGFPDLDLAGLHLSAGLSARF